MIIQIGKTIKGATNLDLLRYGIRKAMGRKNVRTQGDMVRAVEDEIRFKNAKVVVPVTID